MTDDPGEGVAGTWGRDYREAWEPRFRRFFEAQRRVPMNVLLWGPGVGTDLYPKREQIGASLGDDATSVATSEALVGSHDELSAMDDIFLAEEIQGEAADLVIALDVDDRSVIGVHAELIRFGTHPRIGPKIHLFTPRRPATGSQARPLILEAARQVSDARKFEYTPDQYDDCQQIRAKASAWVEAARREKFLADFRARGSVHLSPGPNS